jgi:L-arabinose isomerase
MLSVKNLSLKKIKISPNKKEKEKKIKNMAEQIKRELIKTFLLPNSNYNYKNLVIIMLI